jgi:crotonobetainyl-CoA:carnitine CoA-transferase CaiB-like acyl-CoA transferase
MYRASDDTWFVLIVTPDKLTAVANAIGRADLLTDPRFADPVKLMQNMPQLAEILDQVFAAQPMTHWYQVFNGVHVTFGAVRGPREVIEGQEFCHHGVGPNQTRRNYSLVPLGVYSHHVPAAAAKPAPRAEPMVLELFHRPAQLAFG